MYYIINNDTNDAGYMMSFSYQEDVDGRAFDEGKKFTTDPDELPYLQPPQNPLQVKIKNANKNNPWPSFVEVPIPLLSKQMHEVLLATGVNNLDVYPVDIFHPDGTRTPESDNYLVFNLIGTVTDAELNILTDLPDNEVQEHLMFRLAEITQTILVHESIKIILEQADIPLLRFYNAPKNLYASLMR